MGRSSRRRNKKRRRREQSRCEQELLDTLGRQVDIERLRWLIEYERVSVNCATECGETPLLLSASWNHLDVSRYLLENGADVDVADQDGDTALACAMANGHVAVAELLLEYGADLEPERHALENKSPLAWAMDNHNVEMVVLLLRFGAPTEETLRYGKTYNALYLACWLSSIDIVRLLLEHDNGVVDVNDYVPGGKTFSAKSLLCLACHRNDMEMAQLLIHHGARVIFDDEAYPVAPCPLKCAVEDGSLELVQFLLDNASFVSPILPATTDEDDDAALLPELLVGDDTHPLSPPLDTAIVCNKLQVAQLLLHCDAHVVNDQAFLWRAAKLWRCDMARLLLRAGADVNRADRESGQTPLWVAAKNGHIEMVKELLKAGADVSIRDGVGGETPLWVAYRHGHLRVVFLLLRTSPQVWSSLEAVFK